MRLSLVSSLFPFFQSIPAVRGGGCCPWKSLPPSHLLFLLCLGHRPDGRVVGRTLERRRRLSGAGCRTCREAASIKRGPRAAGAWGVVDGRREANSGLHPWHHQGKFPPSNPHPSRPATFGLHSCPPLNPPGVGSLRLGFLPTPRLPGRLQSGA